MNNVKLLNFSKFKLHVDSWNKVRGGGDWISDTNTPTGIIRHEITTHEDGSWTDEYYMYAADGTNMSIGTAEGYASRGDVG